MADHDDLVANFLAITGANEDQAIQMLEATGYQLQDAIELFFAAGGDTGAAPTAPAAPHNAAGGGGDMDDDEALARRLQAEGAAGGGNQEDEVRAPIPTRRERLYGEDVLFARQAPSRRRENPVPNTVVDAFRDFRAEGEGMAAGAQPGSTSLAAMYEPPRRLLFTQGNFEDAKNNAASQGRWLLLNLQSGSQFASHQLNRDTWGNDMVADLVLNNFVLYQVYEVVEEAQKLVSFYHIFELPSVLVIDPVTGAPMKHWTGYIPAERFLEELLPFLDTHFADPGAARLAANMKRKKTGAGGSGGGGGAGTSAAGVAGGSSGTGGGGGAYDEDADLAAAIAASMHPPPPTTKDVGTSGAGGSGGNNNNHSSAAAAQNKNNGHHTTTTQQQQQQQQQPAPVEDTIMKEEPPPTGPSPEQVAAEAAARLPDEPTTATADRCRIAVRFPDGTRGQRRFLRSAPLSSVHDWCVSLQLEAAGGRQFALSEGFPGAPLLSTTEMDKSLEELKVADAMLVMKWSD